MPFERMTPIWTITQRAHVLFVGANGRSTVGIRVRSIADNTKQGYQREWSINDYTLSRSTPGDLRDCLGMDDAEWDAVMAEVVALDAKLNPPKES